VASRSQQSHLNQKVLYTGPMSLRIAESLYWVQATLRTGGTTVNLLSQYLAAGVVDKLTITIAPVLLGSGKRLFDGTPLAPVSIKVQGSSIVQA
jgi:dihydrofolate reductase